MAIKCLPSTVTKRSSSSLDSEALSVDKAVVSPIHLLSNLKEKQYCTVSIRNSTKVLIFPMLTTSLSFKKNQIPNYYFLNSPALLIP